MALINENFMFTSKTGARLYDKYVKDLPIIDYHCHLSPKQIAEDYKFRNAFDLFLSGDHYKWRQMRSNGVPEELITGNGDEFEKFRAFAKTHAKLIGNPLFHWTQLELKRYFDIDDILCEDNAEEIWDKCNALLARDDFSARNLISKSNVAVVCTTDDPSDTLEYHKAIAEIDGFNTKVLPTFRPDKLVEISKDGWRESIDKTGAKTFEELLSYLTSRIEFFASVGCKLSDHGVDYVPYAEGDASVVFDKKLSGEDITECERDVFRTAVMLHCGREYARLGFTMTDSSANFIFAASDKIDGKRLYLELRERGILIRHFDIPRIAQYNRITVGLPEDMQVLIETIREILENDK